LLTKADERYPFTSRFETPTVAPAAIYV